MDKRTQEIISYWYKKSNKEKKYFNQFIALWISFNCFFATEYFNEAIKITSNKNKGPYESDYYLLSIGGEVCWYF